MPSRCRLRHRAPTRRARRSPWCCRRSAVRPRRVHFMQAQAATSRASPVAPGHVSTSARRARRRISACTIRAIGGTSNARDRAKVRVWHGEPPARRRPGACSIRPTDSAISATRLPAAAASATARYAHRERTAGHARTRDILKARGLSDAVPTTKFPRTSFQPMTRSCRRRQRPAVVQRRARPTEWARR